MSRKLKHPQVDNLNYAKAAVMLARSKTITKKPVTKFKEFKLSHQKRKGARRIKFEDIINKNKVNRKLQFDVNE